MGVIIIYDTEIELRVLIVVLRHISCDKSSPECLRGIVLPRWSLAIGVIVQNPTLARFALPLPRVLHRIFQAPNSLPLRSPNLHHPDAQPSTSHGFRVAIRRPNAPEGPVPDLRKQPKNKDKLNFDEKNAQISGSLFERSASRKSEKQLNVLFGVFGIFMGILDLDHTSSSLLDLHFAGLDGFWKVLLATFIGFLSLVLFIPAAKIARSFWLGTDQIHCNLSMIICG
ncbi:hypothetical protein Ahy_A02g008847 [Arachis hypogaea]|uniref:Uncharacterized protein n=1 Tax=Arachis hypogaea TaxID=3818 RepID=A0A445EFB5_ARAHY|nr:hypothetical protein Ahy_A02g008847 [Arachis hypogaea]